MSIISSSEVTSHNSDFGGEIDENAIVQKVDDDNNSIASWDSDSASDSASDNDQIVSKFWGQNRMSSDSDENDSDDEQDEAAGNANIGTMSLQECIDEEEDEREAMSLNPDCAWEKIRPSQIFLKPPVKRIPPTVKTKPPLDSSSSSNSTKKDFCRFVFISDTHGKHRDIPHLPRGDILVHSGDFTKSGETGTIEDLGAYFRELVDGRQGDSDKKARHSAFSKVICVAGNHDLTLDQDFYDREWQRFHRQGRKFDPKMAQASIRKHSIYLDDESYLLEFPLKDDPYSINHQSSAGTIHVYGSPYSPEHFNWGFMKERGPPIRKIWNKIPSAENGSKPVDVLITHGPPLGRGDLAFLKSGKNGGTTRAGCFDLLLAIQQDIKPKINVFGHIHEGYGVTYDGTTLYVNASTMDKFYQAVHLPIVIDVPLENRSEEICRVVQPSSLFCNATTNICSVEEWIRWCRHRGHDSVANAIEEGHFSARTAEEWFGERKEPLADEFLSCLEIEMEACHRPGRDFRRSLARMVFDLYALAFEENGVDNRCY